MNATSPVLSREELLAVLMMERHGPPPVPVNALSARRAELADMSAPRDPEPVACFVNRLGGHLLDVAPDHLDYLARQTLLRRHRRPRGGR